MCKQHLIIKLKKHTNEIKTFSKWAAALRPDFMGPWLGRICIFALIGLQAKWLWGKPDSGVNRRVGHSHWRQGGRLGASTPASLWFLLPGVSPIS